MYKEYQEGKYLVKETKEGKMYFLNGLFHRDDDLPAVIWSDGAKYWYQNGLHHRINGPAIIYSNKEKYYYINGKKYSEEDYHKIINLLAFI